MNFILMFLVIMIEINCVHYVRISINFFTYVVSDTNKNCKILKSKNYSAMKFVNHVTPTIIDLLLFNIFFYTYHYNNVGT